MFTSQFLGMVIALAAAEDPTPVAMVLAEQGGATVTAADGKSRTVRAMDILKSGEELRADGNVRLVILADGHKERVSGVVTLAEAGASPSENVTVEPGRLSSAQLDGLKRLAQSGRGGVVVPRGVGDGITSEAMKREAVLTGKPTFSWVEVESPSGYYLRVYEVSENSDKMSLLWERVTLGETEVEYPDDEEPLSVGKSYIWLVANGPEDDADTRVFFKFPIRVARAEEQARAEKLLASTADSSAEERLMTAVALHGLDHFTPAGRIFRELVRQNPDEPAYRRIVAEYLKWAGDPKAAEDELARAKQLEEK